MMGSRNFFANLFHKISTSASNMSPKLRSWLPSRGNIVFTLLIVAILFIVQSAGAFGGFRSPMAEPAGSGGLIAYQGRLADTAGNPLTDTFPMIFRLYNQSSGGIPLWEENWNGPNSVAVSDGLFNVMLGSLTPIPQAVVTGNSDLFLGVTVGTDDEMQPRVQIGSVLYARQALTVPDGSITVEKLNDQAVTSIKILDETIASADIKDGTITSADVADGTITSADVADGTITSADIADGTITSADIADSSIISGDIVDGTVSGTDISDGTVSTSDLANSSVTFSKLAPDARSIHIQSGRFVGNTSTPGWPLATSTPSAEAYYVTHVTFAQSFSSVPTISVSLYRLDSGVTTNTRIDVYAENITTTGFDLVMHKWHTTLIYECGASWIAYGNR